jgi:hypothetical protein
LKRTLLASLILLASPYALAQTPETPSGAPAAVSPSSTPAEQAPSGTSPTGAPMPPASATESSAITTTTQPAEAPKAEAPKKDPPWTDRVKLAARAYLRYSYEFGEETRNNNQFNVDRLYFGGDFFATDKVRFQITLDAGATRNSTGNQVLLVETKSAFAEVKDLLGPGIYLRAGILPLAWVPYEEDLWGYRVQGALPLDRWGYTPSADIGLALGGPLPSKYGSFQVNVNNGEGFRFNEIGKRKELQARLTVNPLASMGGPAAGLAISGYGSYGEYDDAGLPARAKSRVVGQVAYQSTVLTLVGSYVVARDANARVKGRYTVSDANIVRGQGMYGFAVLNVGALTKALDGVDLLARLDHLDPDTGLDNNNVDLFIAGVGYRWNKQIKSLVNYETVSYGVDVGGVDTDRPSDKRLKLHTEFRF